MTEEIYSVKDIRKTFHVPNEWKLLADMQYLVTHSYVKEQAKESFVTISKCLKRLGYMEDNNMMIHDYLHYMILDLLDKNQEVFLTENEIRGNNNILSLCAGNTPDFILKKKATDKRRVSSTFMLGISSHHQKSKASTRRLDFLQISTLSHNTTLRAH